MRRAARTLVLTLFTASIAAATAARADSTVIHVSQSRRIALHGVAANIIVGDPTVADVAVFDAHSVILLGKGYGATEVLVTDHAGRTLLDDHVIVTGAAEGGLVTLHRGNTATEYSCSPRCQALTPARESAIAASAAAAATGSPTNLPAASATAAPP